MDIYRIIVLPKTKMVRMVHRNLFYEMGLEISDEKHDLWAKTENLEGSKKKMQTHKNSKNVDFGIYCDTESSGAPNSTRLVE